VGYCRGKRAPNFWKILAYNGINNKAANNTDKLTFQSFLKRKEAGLSRIIIALVLFATFSAFLLTSCQKTITNTATNTTTTAEATTTTSAYTISQLKYQLLAAYPDYFWCDPDLYPIARSGVEQQNAIDQFAAIEANPEEFTAILTHLSLPDKAAYTDDEKLQIYREYKKLNGAVQVTAAASGYTFTIRVGQNQGETYQGTIAANGLITVTSTTPSINTCPICLAEGTLIDTPDGPVPVEKLQQGMTVYTQDAAGKKIAGVIVATASAQSPTGFQIIRIELNDGRVVSASPGHPTTDGRTIGELKVGDSLDGGIVAAVNAVPYSGDTFDILPDGGTGYYWANGILLKSTLAK
jgi:Hint domain